MDDMQIKIQAEIEEAEKKAWDSLSRYKFQMFGYWAAIWVHLNRINDVRKPNPFGSLVAESRKHLAALAEKGE